MGYLGAAFWFLRTKNYLDNSTYLLLGQHFCSFLLENQAIFVIFRICLGLINRGQSAYCYFVKLLYKMG